MIQKLRGLFMAVFAALLAVALVPSAALALAPNGGSLTVSNLTAGDQVQLYKVASITVNPDNTLKKEWTDITTDKSFADYEKMSDAEKADFANTVASTITGDPVATQKADGTSVTFNKLDAGLYYARVSNDKDVSVVYANTLIPVNVEPQSDGTWAYAQTRNVNLKKSDVKVTKTVSADGKTYDKSTSGVSTNGTVYYKVEVTVPQYNGATERTFSLSDTLPDGITLNADSVKVDGAAVTPAVDGQKFTVNLSNQLATKGGQKVTVTYTAKLTGTDLVADGRVNTATLTFSANSYGTDTKTTSDTATVNNGGIKIIKVAKDDTSKKLQGAEFKITVNGTDYTATTDANGVATFDVALAADNYKVSETKAPAGYSKVADQTVAVSASNTVEGSNTVTIEDPADTAAGLLPNTGGTGTIALTVAGVAVLAGAATVLVRNRKQD